jgi:hypothetical protein
MRVRIEVDELYPEYVLMPASGGLQDVEIPESLNKRYDKAAKAYYQVQAELKEIYEKDLGEEERDLS